MPLSAVEFVREVDDAADYSPRAVNQPPVAPRSIAGLLVFVLRPVNLKD